MKALQGLELETDREVEVFAKISADRIPELSIDEQIRQLRGDALQWLYDADDLLSASERETS